MSYLRLYLFIIALFCSVSSVFAEQLDINTANPLQLTEHMVGIGPSKAAAIVEYRGANGPFQSIDDLVEVKGISSRTVEKNRSRITARSLRSKP